MVHLRMTWGQVSDSFGVLEKNPLRVTFSTFKLGRKWLAAKWETTRCQEPDIFCREISIKLNFPLLVSQLGSIPRAWKLHSTDAADYGLSTLSSISDNDTDPSIYQAGSKFECNQFKDYWCHHTPQWKVDERVVHPSWAWIVFLHCEFPGTADSKFGSRHIIAWMPEVVPKLHWRPGISNWNPRAEGAQTWVGSLVDWVFLMSRVAKMEDLTTLVTHHSDISDVFEGCPFRGTFRCFHFVPFDLPALSDCRSSKDQTWTTGFLGPRFLAGGNQPNATAWRCDQPL